MTFKIIVFPMTGVGHINPMIKMVNELIKTYNAKVIVYSIRDFRSHIEVVGAEYRTLDDVKYEDEIIGKIKSGESTLKMIYKFMDSVYDNISKNTLRIADIIEQEKPDAVLYDNFQFDAKLAIDVLRQKYDRSQKRLDKPPPLIAYWTTFASEEGVYPNDFERKNGGFKLTKFELLRFFGSVIWYSFKFRRLFRRLNLPYPGLRQLAKKDSFILNLVLVVPELQPRAHLFDSNTKFVGAAISDDVHVTGVQTNENPVLDSILQEFPIINPTHKYTLTLPLDDETKETPTKKLIYVSLGTIHNNNVNVYSIIIDAFKNLDGSNDFLVVISLGKDLYRKFKEKISNKTMNIPDNIILTASAPQLEILKRASLFVSHGGMNSTSESVHYGVPMINIPMHGDQFGNAYRIGTELGLGIQLDMKTLTPHDVKQAVEKILRDKSYYKRCNRYSKVSAEYVGHKKAAEIIINSIK